MIVFGNTLIIIAVMKKRLRAATRMFILSLAVSDLMTGIIVFPISAINEVLSGYWIFGDLMCITWITVDIWLCTTSIYNLVATSIDRLIAITKPLHHAALVTRGRAYMTITAIWTGSFLLNSPNFLFANTYKSMGDQCVCIPIYTSRTYVIFSASFSFYVPMAIIVFIYTKIYIATRRAMKGATLYNMPSTITMSTLEKESSHGQYKIFR
uniref:G-protein coupled receptors family 1 profile domain-containing protein n=1 Tax=Setaria digitata TaxID=48799 RepID=A0A915PTQ7_9BILA